ncbi:TPA: hypothetical protein ACGCGJ_000429 [Stenotrophomonas maltophilia]
MTTWNPISTAPKNTPVLIYAGGQQFVAWLQDDASDEYRSEDEGESDLNGMWCVTDNKLGPFALRGGRPSHWKQLDPDPEDV